MKCCEKWKWDVTSHHYKAEGGMINCWNKTYNFCPECNKPLKQESEIWCKHNQNMAGAYTRCLICNPIKPSEKIEKIERLEFSYTSPTVSGIINDRVLGDSMKIQEIKQLKDKVNKLVDAHNKI